MDGDEERLEKLKKLSNRELEVLRLVCQRHTYKEIGELLFIAEGTVQFHIGNIYQKLEVAELAKAARQRELGLFCPLLGDIPKQLPGTVPEEPEPPPPPPGVLAKVREDEPPEIITVNVLQRRGRAPMSVHLALRGYRSGRTDWSDSDVTACSRLRAPGSSGSNGDSERHTVGYTGWST